MVLDALQRYQQGGNSALGTYRDKNHPTQVAETFASLLHEIKALPAYLPELEQYLLKYPDAASDQIKSDFYWEKVNFGFVASPDTTMVTVALVVVDVAVKLR